MDKDTQKLIKWLRVLEADLKEVKPGTGCDPVYLGGRLKKRLDDFEDGPPKPVHGGGTGTQ